MGVKFTTLVVVREADTRLLNVSGDLNVCTSLHKLNTGDRARSDEPRAVALLGAVCDDSRLDVSDDISGLGRAPEAEVILHDKGVT